MMMMMKKNLMKSLGGKWVEFFFALLSTAKKEREKVRKISLVPTRSPRDLMDFKFFLMDLCKRGIMKLLAKDVHKDRNL